jgi:putative heme-binding domain-containing protein
MIATAKWALALATLFPLSAAAQDSTMVRLLKGGRVPEERQGTVIGMIGKRGSDADLAYIYGRAIEDSGFSPKVRLAALDALAEAALTRKSKPSGDLSGLGRLIRPKGDGSANPDEATRLAAIRLAALWGVESTAPALREIAEATDASRALRAAALDALATLGGEAGRASIEALTAADKPWEVRALAVASLARTDVDAAVAKAAPVLADAGLEADPAPALASLLSHRDAPEKLARAIAGAEGFSADAAKLTLRAMYSLGRTDAPLVAELSRIAGLDAEVKPLDDAGMARLVAEVAEEGDPSRGEAVFRRPDLNCTQCHAVAGAGGGIGPELSAIGSSSPPDYIVNAVLLPDQAIKEAYETLVVQTTDGQIFQGIVVDRDENRLILKEATGEQRTIPASEIEDSRPGGSLMPKGLTNMMTRDELADLVRFLSELGKPGPYALKTTPTIQRWRLLQPVPDGLDSPDPDSEALRRAVLESPDDAWAPVYALFSGTLPLDELARRVAGPVLFLRGEIDVAVAGPVTFRVDSPDGLAAWIDGEAVSDLTAITKELSKGRHAITFRVDTGRRQEKGLKVEVVKPQGAGTEFAVVGGR